MRVTDGWVAAAGLVGDGVATAGVTVDNVARGSVVSGLLVSGLLVPDVLVRSLVAAGRRRARPRRAGPRRGRPVAACAPEAESAGAEPAGAVVAIGVGGMVAPVGAPAEFPPATSSLPGVLAGGPLEGLNNPPAVMVVTVAREVRLESMAAPRSVHETPCARVRRGARRG